MKARYDEIATGHETETQNFPLPGPPEQFRQFDRSNEFDHA